MTPDEQERLDIISSALARLVNRQDELESRIRYLEARHPEERLDERPEGERTRIIATPVPAPHPFIATPPRTPFPVNPAGSPPPIPPAIPVQPPPISSQPISSQPVDEHEAAAPPPIPPPIPPQIPMFAQVDSGRPAEQYETQASLTETTVGLTWINRIAVVTLIIGVAFFFKYAVDSGWIGPTLRVLLGLASAGASLFFGDRMWRRGHAVFSQGLMGLGIALLYLSFYASFALYSLLPQSAAFAFMAMTTVAAGFMGVQYGSQAIAVLGLIGGYATPVLLSTGEDHPWFLFTYTFLLNAASLSLARVRNWMALEYLSLATTVILYAGWFSEKFSPSNHAVAATFAIAFYAEFAAAQARSIVFIAQLLAALAALAIEPNPSQRLLLGLIYSLGGLVVAEVRRWRETPSWTLVCFWLPFGLWFTNRAEVLDPNYTFGLFTAGFAMFFAWVIWWAVISKRALRSTDLTMFIGNAATYFAASYYVLNPIHHEWMGYFAIALCLIHGAAAKLLVRDAAADSPDNESSVLAMAVALAFLTLAIPIQFAGFRITIAWSLQGAALAWLSERYKNTKLAIASYLVFALVLARLFLLDSWIPSDGIGLRFLTFVVAAVGLWLAAWCRRRDPAGLIAYLAGHAVLLWSFGLEFSGFERPLAWTLQATVMAWIATRYENGKNRIASWMVFLLVIGQLFVTIDWGNASAFGMRFLTFGAAAVGLWAAAWLARQETQSAAAPYVAGHFVMLWNLGMEVVAWINRAAPVDALSVQTTAISVLMSLYALMLVVLGVATRSVLNRVLGLGLFGVVIAKLYLSDVWQLSRILRITAFLALGVVLLLVSYLYSRFKPVIEKLWKDEKAS